MSPKLAATLIRLAGWGFITFCTVFVTIAFAGYDGFAHRIADIFDWIGPPHDEALTRDARFMSLWGFSLGTDVCLGSAVGVSWAA